MQKKSIWKGMPQEFTSSFLFLWITPLNTLRRVEKSTFSGEKTAKSRIFGAEYLRYTAGKSDKTTTADKTQTASAGATATNGGETEEGGVNVLAIVLIVAGVLVLAGGGVAVFFILKKKDDGSKNGGDNA